MDWDAGASGQQCKRHAWHIGGHCTLNSTEDTGTASAGKAGQSDKQTNPFETLVGAWLEQSRIWQPQALADAFSASPLFERGPAAMVPVATILFQAYLQSMSSSVRFGGRLTETMAQCQARMIERLSEADVASAADGESLRVLIDDARACLREVAELSADEARALQSNVAALDDALRTLAGEPSEPAGSGRRWKVKP